MPPYALMVTDERTGRILIEREIPRFLVERIAELFHTNLPWLRAAGRTKRLLESMAELLEQGPTRRSRVRVSNPRQRNRDTQPEEE